jgi:S1-C subfamily serine protease
MMRSTRMAVTAVGIGILVLGVATPTVRAQSLLQRLEQRLNGLAERAEVGGAATESGPAERGYLGLIGDDAGEGGRGVRVLSVKQGGAAEAAGIRDGDLVTGINGKAITRLSDMGSQLADATVGTRLIFQVERDGKRAEIPVVLGRQTPSAELPAPPDPGAPSDPGGAEPNPLGPGAATSPLEAELQGNLRRPTKPSLGVTVTDVTDAARQRYGLNVTRGALVTSVRSGSPADQAGVPLGAVIVALAGNRIDSPADLARAAGELRPDEDVELTFYQGDRLSRKTLEMGAALAVSPPDLPAPLGPAASAPGAPATGGAPPAAREPALRLGDRPLLGRIERAISGIAQAEAGGPTSPGNEVERLRQEVDALRRHVLRLEQRLNELEQQGKGN